MPTCWGQGPFSTAAAQPAAWVKHNHNCASNMHAPSSDCPWSSAGQRGQGLAFLTLSLWGRSVTEAGEGEDGRMKSAIGIGSLLMDGLGDTIRVSLTEDPELEINPCRREC